MKEKTLNRHMNIITNKVIKAFPSVEGIILYGSFGRDEGSWFKNESGQEQPYNDYDILVICENHLPQEKVNTIRKELAEQIGINWIDIGQKTRRQLTRLKPTIYNFDLKHGSRVIFGNSEALNLIPNFKSSQLPLKEGETLFYTRLWTFLGSLNKQDTSNGTTGIDIRFFRNQMAKAVLAVVDVCLLQIKSYDSSYVKRVAIAAKLRPLKQNEIELMNWALEEKLNPQNTPMNADEIDDLYRKVQKLYLKHMHEILSKIYRIKITNPETIEWALKWTPKNLVRRVARLIIRRNFKLENVLAVNIAQCYIMSSKTNNLVKNEYLHRGIKYIRKLDPSFNRDSNWDDARSKVAQLRMEV